MVLVYLYEHHITKYHKVRLCSHVPEQGIGSEEFVEIATNSLAFTKSKIRQNSWLSQ